MSMSSFNDRTCIMNEDMMVRAGLTLQPGRTLNFG